VALRLLVGQSGQHQGAGDCQFKKGGWSLCECPLPLPKKDCALGAYAKPDGVAQEDYDKQKVSFTELFHNVIGYCAWQMKDYPTAQTHLKLSVAGNPTKPGKMYTRWPFRPCRLLHRKTCLTVCSGLLARRTCRPIPRVKNKSPSLATASTVKYHGAEDGWAQLTGGSQDCDRATS